MKQKTFTHIDKAWAEDLEELTTTNKNGSRWYECPIGSLPSVTTVTGWEKQAFFAKWRKENPKESKRVLSRGNTLHATIEDYISNKEIDLSTIPPIEVELFLQMKDELDNIDNIHELETALWSETTMLAGRVDCVAEYNGKLSIIDFKGSTRKKRKGDIGNYFLQATAYAIAFQERTGVAIDNFVILISSEDGAVQVFEGNPLNYTKALLETIQSFHKAMELV
jgi:ATP-dependent exoDNAse (exonuclease V) beta subunit